MSGFAHDIAGGAGNLVIDSLQSPNFVHNVSGWQVSKDGNAEFNQVQARGQVFVAGTGGSEIAIILTGGVPIIQLIPASVTQLTSKPEIFSNADFAGLVNESMILNLVSGKSNGQSDAGIQLFSEAADGSSPAAVVFEFGGAVAATMTSAGLTADSWHQATLAGSWTGSGSGVNGLFYTRTVDGDVRIKADIINATATGNSTCFTLPSGYIPATSQNFGGVGWNNPQPNNSASLPWVFVSSSGAVQLTGIEVANRQLFFDVRAPLGAL